MKDIIYAIFFATLIFSAGLFVADIDRHGRKPSELVYDIQGCAYIVTRNGPQIDDMWRVEGMDKKTCTKSPGEI